MTRGRSCLTASNLRGNSVPQPLERELTIATHTNKDVIALAEPALEHGERKLVLNQPLDGPLQRPRAKGGVVALLGNETTRFGHKLDRHLSLGQEVLETSEL